MINHLPPPRRLDADHWRAVHRAGDRNPPIVLHEPQRPFWAPDWELDHDHWRRRPRALVGLWIGLALASLGAWAVILWAVGAIGGH